MTMVASAWVANAACRDATNGLFYRPIVGESDEQRHDRVRRAKAICAECSVREACLAYALRVREPLGIWGGLTELERRHLGHEPRLTRSVFDDDGEGIPLGRSREHLLTRS